ncbi:MAG: hypothetical protein RI907_2196 [Pseudomonadota bacterium]|jgi:hypothetical protein
MVSGRYDAWGNASGVHTIDFNELYADLPLSFTSVRATFTAELVPHLAAMGQTVTETLLPQSFIGVRAPDNNCAFPGIAWCANVYNYIEVTQANLYSETDRARLDVTLGTASGSDDARGTLTDVRQTLLSTTGFHGFMYERCWRRFKIEPPCRLNFEPGLWANL